MQSRSAPAVYAGAGSRRREAGGFTLPQSAPITAQPRENRLRPSAPADAGPLSVPPLAAFAAIHVHAGTSSIALDLHPERLWSTQPPPTTTPHELRYPKASSASSWPSGSESKRGTMSMGTTPFSTSG